MTWFTGGEDKQGVRSGRFNMAPQSLEVEHVLDNSPSASRPQIHASGDTVTVVWKHFSGERTGLLTRVSNDAGTTWSEPFKLAATKEGSDHPIIITRHEEIFVSWHTQAEGYQLIAVQHEMTRQGE